MKTILSAFLAYCVACMFISLIGIIILIWIDAGQGVGSAIGVWFIGALVVGGVAVIPTAFARWLAWKYQAGNTISAAIVGGIIGSSLFAVFFGPWPSSYYLGSWVEIVLSGAGLGVVGGAIYWWTERWLHA